MDWLRDGQEEPAALMFVMNNVASLTAVTSDSDVTAFVSAVPRVAAAASSVHTAGYRASIQSREKWPIARCYKLFGGGGSL